MRMEIERRFLVDGRSDKPWRGDDYDRIVQYYLDGVNVDDGQVFFDGKRLASSDFDLTQITTWRLRDYGGGYILTAKGERLGASAIEYEWEIDSETWGTLDLTGLPCVSKTRYYWRGVDDLLWEIDEFEGVLGGLIIAEVELEDEGQEVIIPNWTNLELTHLPGWSNASLSKMIKHSKLN